MIRYIFLLIAGIALVSCNHEQVLSEGYFKVFPIQDLRLELQSKPYEMQKPTESKVVCVASLSESSLVQIDSIMINSQLIREDLESDISYFDFVDTSSPSGFYYQTISGNQIYTLIVERTKMQIYLVEDNI